MAGSINRPPIKMCKMNRSGPICLNDTRKKKNDTPNVSKSSNMDETCQEKSTFEVLTSIPQSSNSNEMCSQKCLWVINISDF